MLHFNFQIYKNLFQAQWNMNHSGERIMKRFTWQFSIKLTGTTQFVDNSAPFRRLTKALPIKESTEACKLIFKCPTFLITTEEVSQKSKHNFCCTKVLSKQPMLSVLNIFLCLISNQVSCSFSIHNSSISYTKYGT